MFSPPSPISVHFGALDTRLLQLQGRPGRWSVKAAHCLPAKGKARHAEVADQLKPMLRSLRFRGKNSVISLSGEAVAVSLVPVDAAARPRLEQLLQDAAGRAVEDVEGVSYRYLSLSESSANAENQREELLLLTAGQSEIRRCTEAIQGMGLLPVGLEMNAFPIARALHQVQMNRDESWGFLNLGLNNSAFGIFYQNELRFLKPLQTDGNRLLQALQRVTQRIQGRQEAAEDFGGVGMVDLLAGGVQSEAAEAVGSESPASVETSATATLEASPSGNPSLQSIQEEAVEHAAEILKALRMETEMLVQEVRACERHFSNRNQGEKVERIFLTGFGAALPEIDKALESTLGKEVEIAKPFSSLCIQAPEEVLQEEHLWCTALGLALRAYA